jgi:hypothetical protein
MLGAGATNYMPKALLTASRSVPRLRLALALTMLFAAGLFQQGPALRELNHKLASRLPFVSQVRSAVERSAHPELYQASGTFQFVEHMPGDDEVHKARYYALRYALAPALLEDGSKSDRWVVFFNDPRSANQFESANGLCLLDSLGDDVRIYQRSQE